MRTTVDRRTMVIGTMVIGAMVIGAGLVTPWTLGFGATLPLGPTAGRSHASAKTVWLAAASRRLVLTRCFGTALDQDLRLPGLLGDQYCFGGQGKAGRLDQTRFPVPIGIDVRLLRVCPGGEAAEQQPRDAADQPRRRATAAGLAGDV
jgi:hypothetical protein